VAWAERTVERVLPDVPYVQLVFTIPRILRKAFLFRRELYGELSRVAFAATRDFFREHFPSLDEPVPAMLVVPQSFGDLLIPHPHLHAPTSLGVFDKEGVFHPAPDDLDFSPLSRLFAEHTFAMLLENDAVTPERVELIKSWQHWGFNVDATRRIARGQRPELEKLLQYIHRPPVSLQRLRCGQDGRCTYKGRYHPRLKRDYQLVTGLEFLDLLVPQIALRYEARIKNFGAISTKKRIQFGWIAGQGDHQAPSPTALDDQDSDFVRARKKNWARLIAKTFLCDPEVCPKCGAKMKLVAAISSPAQDQVIEKILRHIGAWDPPWQRQPKARAPPRQRELFSGDSGSQLPAIEEEDVNQDAPGFH
jgi:hypothetical protein